MLLTPVRRQSMEDCVSDAVHLYAGTGRDWGEVIGLLLTNRIHAADPPYAAAELEEMVGMCLSREGNVSEIILYRPA